MKSIIFLLFLTSLWISSGLGKQGKKRDTLGERVQELSDISSKRPVIKLNADKFNNFVKSTPRNYSMIVMFTALATQRQCVVCRQANDEYQIVANSYRYSQVYSNSLYFAMVDFDEGGQVFQQLGLNTAPIFMHFPAKGKPKNSDTMDLQRLGVSAESIARWVTDRTEINIHVFRPPNYSSAIFLVISFGFLAVLIYVKRNSLSFLANPNTWAVLALAFAFAMMSGQMWNQIRGPPMLHKNQHGNVMYIHGSSQGQFVIETYIIFLLHAAIVVGMLALIEGASYKGDVKKGRFFVIVGLVIVVFFFSLLLSIFRSKAGGYPYSFLFK